MQNFGFVRTGGVTEPAVDIPLDTALYPSLYPAPVQAPAPVPPPPPAALMRFAQENQRLSAENTELQRAVTALKQELQSVSNAALVAQQKWAEERAALLQRASMTTDALELQTQLVELQTLVDRLVQDKRDLTFANTTLENMYQQLRLSHAQREREAAADDLWCGGVFADEGAAAAALAADIIELQESDAAANAGTVMDAVTVTDADADETASRRAEIKAELYKKSEREVTRSYNVEQLTEMLGAFGCNYASPKLVSVKLLLKRCAE